jgi:hypothetical protein
MKRSQSTKHQNQCTGNPNQDLVDYFLGTTCEKIIDEINDFTDEGRHVSNEEMIEVGKDIASIKVDE